MLSVHNISDTNAHTASTASSTDGGKLNAAEKGGSSDAVVGAQAPTSSGTAPYARVSGLSMLSAFAAPLENSSQPSSSTAPAPARNNNSGPLTPVAENYASGPGSLAPGTTLPILGKPPASLRTVTTFGHDDHVRNCSFIHSFIG
jgi:hypothetical protein